MKRLIFAGMLVLITTAAQAQAYTTLGPAGAGGYRSGAQRDNESATPVAFAKSVVSGRGSQTFATVSYPDKTLIVEFRLEPYSAGKATAVRAFGEITKQIAQGAFSKFPKIRSVQLIGNLAQRDKHGNDIVDRAVMVKFSKVKAATINWENVDPAKIVEIADTHWILPELGADNSSVK
jgi:hypothetical protein